MTLLSRVSGLVRDIAFAQLLGAGLMADAFFVAFRIPNFLRRIFGEGAFTVAFVPVFTQLHQPGKKRHANQFVNLMAGRLGLILVVLSTLGILFAPQIVWLLAPGYIDEPLKFQVTVDTLRLTFPYLLFISLVAMSAGILNTCGRFAAAAITPLFLNICLIAAVFWLVPLFENAALALGFGVLIAGIAQLMFQLPFLRREGLIPRPTIALRHEDSREPNIAVAKVFRLMIPALFGSSVAQINILVNTLLASFLVTGSISWLYYSDRLMEFPLGVFGIALATAILPGLSRSYSAGDMAGFNHTLNVAMRWVCVISLPAAAALAVLAVPLLATMFNYREFSQHDVLMSARALEAYSIGLIGFVFVKVLAPGFFARQNTATPVRVGAVSMVVNVVTSLALFSILAHVGLALATSLAAMVNAALLAWILHKEGILSLQRGMLVLVIRVLFATFAMAVVLWFFAGEAERWLDAGALYRIGQLSIAVLLGLVTYVITLLAAGVRLKHLALDGN